MRREFYILGVSLLIISLFAPDQLYQKGSVASVHQSSEDEQFGNYFKEVYKSSKSSSKKKASEKKSSRTSLNPSVWKTPKKKKKKTTVNTDLQTSPVQNFTLGPGPDRETFLLETVGSGIVTFNLSWTGSAPSLRMDVLPAETPEKMTSGTSAMKKKEGALAALLALFNANTNTDISSPESVNNSSNFISSVTTKEGQSPL